MELCAQVLKQQGHAVVITRNPGGTDLGQEIRRILLHHPGFVSPTCELLLYMADRAQHMDETVLPALEAGQIVLCDRHIDSTVAYQGYGRNLSLPLIEELNTIATHGRQPHLTLLFDGPPDILAQRVSDRGAEDRLEREALSFRERVREGYLKLSEAQPERIRVLNALESVETLHQQVLDLLSPLLKGAVV